MSEQDNANFNYGEVSLRELAIKGIIEGLKAEYMEKSGAVPSEDQLRFLAEDRYEKSKKNGNGHLGTAERII